MTGATRDAAGVRPQNRRLHKMASMWHRDADLAHKVDAHEGLVRPAIVSQRTNCCLTHPIMPLLRRTRPVCARGSMQRRVSGWRLLGLAFSSLGVVYGDIGGHLNVLSLLICAHQPCVSLA